MKSYGRQPMTVETWPGPMKRVQAQVRRVEDRLDRRDDRDVVAEDGEVASMPSAFARSTVSAVDGRGRLEADRVEDDLRGPGSAARSAARRAASRPSGCRRRGRSRRGSEPSPPGTRIMSPKQVRITPSLLGDRDAVVDPAHRDHADRAAGAVHQLDVVRQVVLHAIAVDGVGVPAAHLHELVVPAGLAQRGDLARRAPAASSASRNSSTNLICASSSRAARVRRRRAPAAGRPARDGADQLGGHRLLPPVVVPAAGVRAVELDARSAGRRRRRR